MIDPRASFGSRASNFIVGSGAKIGVFAMEIALLVNSVRRDRAWHWLCVRDFRHRRGDGDE
jgi:hypothetical protein